MDSAMTVQGAQFRIKGRFDLIAARAVESLLGRRTLLESIDLSRAEVSSDVALAALARALRELAAPSIPRLVGLTQRQCILLRYLGLDAGLREAESGG